MSKKTHTKILQKLQQILEKISRCQRYLDAKDIDAKDIDAKDIDQNFCKKSTKIRQKIS